MTTDKDIKFLGYCLTDQPKRKVQNQQVFLQQMLGHYDIINNIIMDYLVKNWPTK